MPIPLSGLVTLFLELPILIGALAAIALVVLLFFLVKKYVWKIIVNSILGVIAFVIIKVALGIALPFWPTLIVAIVFGIAGIGVELLLYYAGVLAI